MAEHSLYAQNGALFSVIDEPSEPLLALRITGDLPTRDGTIPDVDLTATLTPEQAQSVLVAIQRFLDRPRR